MKSELRILVLIGLAAGFVASLFYLSHVYACLTVAFVLAYFLEPVVGWLEQKGVSRDVGAPGTLIVFFTGLVLVGMGIVPRIVEQGGELIRRLPHVYLGVAQALGPWSERLLGYNAFQDVDKLAQSVSDPASLVQPIGGALSGFVGNLLGHTLKLVTTVLGLTIIPLLAYYLLRDLPTFHARLMYLVPKRHHKFVNDVIGRLDGVLGGFIRGQLVVSSVLSAYYCTALVILGVRLGLVLGLLAGFSNIVPYLGILSTLTLTMLIAFVNGATGAKFAAIAVVFALGMATEGSILTPRIVGRKVGLEPLALILALLVGAELLGLAGMLLAVPIAAIAKVFASLAVERYRRMPVFQKD